MQAKKSIAILGTGGTIAGAAPESAGDALYTAGVLSIESLLAAVPALADAATLHCEQVANVDSKDMSDALWLRVAARVKHWLQRGDIDACLVTHGTDTLEETAYFLHLVHASAKPCVMTAAMRPATSAEADGPRNLLDALRVAAHEASRGRGVLCVLQGRIHAAREVRKLHTQRIDAFSSGDVAPLGEVDARGELRYVRSAAGEPGAPYTLADELQCLPPVAIVLSHAGVDAAVVRHHVQQGVRGLVVAGTGNGTVHVALEQALRDAQAQGVRVVRASRVPLGEVPALEGRAFEASGELSPYKARVRLQLELLREQAAVRSAR